MNQRRDSIPGRRAGGLDTTGLTNEAPATTIGGPSAQHQERSGTFAAKTMAEQRYRVTERLEAGGMAEVFVGEAASVQGFKKKVAIKRVLPHLAQNRNFIAMFLDEARLGAKLNHANIVSVFDIGAADNTYFIVMEYVDGTNLKTLMEALRKQGKRFPLKEALYLCMEACRALSYAHELTDDNEVPLNIVHRDISPPNILVSRRGEVKVTDFGLAKATTQLEKTDPGVVKGKFGYLSPEAAMGEAVDGRSDVFSLGIVLWEMLAGRRLFLGDTDYHTVKLVQRAEIPKLDKFNPDVDPNFETVLHKALARDKDQRFESAREFGDALAGYLFRHQLKVTSYDIAHLVKTTVEAKRGKPLSDRDQSMIDQLILEEMQRFTSLDEMNDPLSLGAKPLNPDEVDGTRPLDAGQFENPAEWFSDDEDVAAALGDYRPNKPNERRGWLESGVETVGTQAEPGNLANLLESELGLRSERPPSTQTPPPTPPAVPKGSSPSGPAISNSSLPPTLSMSPELNAMRSKLGWKAVAITLIVLAGAGAAAWFGGILPI